MDTQQQSMTVRCADEPPHLTADAARVLLRILRKYAEADERQHDDAEVA